MELLDHMVDLFLIFWEPSIFSIHSRCTFSFSPHLCQHLLSHVFLMTAVLTVRGNISLWFWFAFLWCLEILSIFSHVYCLFWCPLWEKESIFSSSALCKIRLFGGFFVCLLLNWPSSLYILDNNPLSDIWFTKIFPILSIVFSFC